MTSGDSVVCILEADPAVRDSLEILMDLSNIKVRGYSTIQSFLLSLDSQNVRCLLCEAEMPDGSGIQLFSHLQSKGVHYPFALLMSEHKPRTYQQAIKLGIENIYRKPLINPAGLLRFIRQPNSKELP